MSSQATPALVVSLHLSAIAAVTALWNMVQPHPYMDEIFHVPQAQRYCQGDYWTWDHKLTTPPGLYVISNILLLVQRPFCSTLLLRLTNLLYPLLILYAVSSLLGRLHSHLTAQERLTSAAVILFFPNLWFYNFLYYTDGGSVAFVLLSWLSAKRRRHLLAALFSAIALTFRQTNIIWSLFILGTSLLDLANPTERRQFDPKAAFIRSFSDVLMAVVGFIGMLWQKLFVAVTMTLPYIGLLAGFAAFVHWNGGIVLGDRSNHVPVLHVAQLFYFVGFAASMSFFAILGVVPLARLLPQPTLRGVAALMVVTPVMAFCIQKFTFVHPFLLADNRHYTFYLWRIISRGDHLGLYALIPVYIFSAWSCWQAIATEQTVLWIVIYMVATVLTLIPSPLLEFRYFIMPYMIYRIAMRQPRGSWLMLEFLVYLALNVFTVAMFLYKPFRWPHEEGLQRFMW